VSDQKGASQQEQQSRTRDQQTAATQLQGLQDQVESLREHEQKVTTELREQMQRELAAKDNSSRSEMKELNQANQQEIEALQAQIKKWAAIGEISSSPRIGNSWILKKRQIQKRMDCLFRLNGYRQL
jgi:ferritin